MRALVVRSRASTLMPLASIGDAGGLQTQAVDRGLATSSYQQMGAAQRLRARRPRSGPARAPLAGPRHARAAATPSAWSRRAHDSDQLRVVLGQDRALVDQDDLGAQATERLGQLAADRPATQHQERPWQLPAGRRRSRWSGSPSAGQPGHWRDRRPAAGRDDEAARADPVPAGLRPGPAPVNRACSRSTVTPSPSNRSTLSCGAMPAMTPRTCRRTAAKSTAGAGWRDAERPRLRAAWAAAAAAIRLLDGTQPTFRQSPPMAPRSISTTDAPSCTAPAATLRPAEPAPMTQRSGVRVWCIAGPLGCPIGPPGCDYRHAIAGRHKPRGITSP